MFTPTKHITYSYQDYDEQSHLRRDVDARPSEYLKHPDAQVRCLADWYLRYRDGTHGAVKDFRRACREAAKLYDRLKELA
jgi:hypothetical protein